MEVSELTVKLDASTTPKYTSVAPVNELPLMLTVVALEIENPGYTMSWAE